MMVSMNWSKSARSSECGRKSMRGEVYVSNRAQVLCHIRNHTTWHGIENRGLMAKRNNCCTDQLYHQRKSAQCTVHGIQMTWFEWFEKRGEIIFGCIKQIKNLTSCFCCLSNVSTSGKSVRWPSFDFSWAGSTPVTGLYIVFISN